MSDTVLCEIRDRVALLTLNRPHNLNALNYETDAAIQRSVTFAMSK